MPGTGVDIAARRTHRYADTRPWIILNSVLSNVFDVLDVFIALSISVALGRRTDTALRAFKRIIRRHLADIQVYHKCATSDNFRTTLLQVAAVKALRLVYLRCANHLQLRYLDFIYLQTAVALEESLNERPILDVTWNNHELLKDMCSPSSACIILALHNGFTHTARALSFSKKKIAVVSANPSPSLIATYQINKVRNPQDIEIIPVNRHTLLTLTKILKQDKAIICAPDYRSETGNYDCLSLGMFKLAEYSRVPLYFVDYLIDESGILHGFIKGPIENKAAESVAEDFLSFCRSVSGRDLSIIPNSWREWHCDSYNDAVVNIFTRLNTAGDKVRNLSHN
jgi:hypothetical protein